MREAPRIAVIADDLTSAADSCGPFARKGGSAVIQLGNRIRSADIDVLAVDLDTRHRSPEVAAARVAASVRQRASVPILFKSVDSTLRGNVGAEIIAAARCARRPVTVLAPAFPAQGRTTSAGVQLLHGTPVHETAFGSDASNPVRSSTLTDMVPGARRMSAGSVQARGNGVLVADAENDADLDALVADFPRVHDVLWIGSPGLAAALARAVELKGVRSVAAVQSRRTLLVIGSRHPASQRQLEVLSRCGTQVFDAGLPGAADAARQALTTSSTVALVDASRDASPRSAEVRLARTAAELARTSSFEGLVLTGGATANAVLRRLRFPRIDIVDETDPGIVIGVVPGRPPVALALKAGGFGGPESLREIVRTLGPEPREDIA